MGRPFATASSRSWSGRGGGKPLHACQQRPRKCQGVSQPRTRRSATGHESRTAGGGEPLLLTSAGTAFFPRGPFSRRDGAAFRRCLAAGGHGDPSLGLFVSGTGLLLVA